MSEQEAIRQGLRQLDRPTRHPTLLPRDRRGGCTLRLLRLPGHPARARLPRLQDGQELRWVAAHGERVACLEAGLRHPRLPSGHRDDCLLVGRLLPRSTYDQGLHRRGGGGRQPGRGLLPIPLDPRLLLVGHRDDDHGGLRRRLPHDGGGAHPRRLRHDLGYPDHRDAHHRHRRQLQQGLRLAVLRGVAHRAVHAPGEREGGQAGHGGGH
mmetsp:Transcript_65941/g.159056  ORF Transcript_65941/g.159056 Transcript_65941/m.159056 type:complete len:210 (-) Transcript_65941:92-721(-)